MAAWVGVVMLNSLNDTNAGSDLTNILWFLGLENFKKVINFAFASDERELSSGRGNFPGRG